MQRWRLALEAKDWEFQAKSLLDAIHLQPGWTCLDLGCGPVGMRRLHQEVVRWSVPRAPGSSEGTSSLY